MDPLLDDMKAVRLRLNLSNIFLQGKLEIIIYPRTNFKIVILSSYDSSLYKNLALNRELVKIVREYQCRSLLVISYDSELRFSHQLRQFKTC